MSNIVQDHTTFLGELEARLGRIPYVTVSRTHPLIEVRWDGHRVQGFDYDDVIAKVDRVLKENAS